MLPWCPDPLVLLLPDNRKATRRMLKLVCFVYLVHLVYLVQSNKRDKPNNGLFALTDFFSILLQPFVGGDGGGECEYQILWLLEVVIVEQRRMRLQVGGIEISCHKVRLLHDLHHKRDRRLHPA